MESSPDFSPPAAILQQNPGDPGTLLFENSSVRVWELVLGPGEWCRWHYHEFDHLLLVATGSSIVSLRADGQRQEVDIPSGQGLFVPKSSTLEIAGNTSASETLRELIIDLKHSSFAADRSGAFQFFFSGAGLPTVGSS